MIIPTIIIGKIKNHRSPGHARHFYPFQEIPEHFLQIHQLNNFVGVEHAAWKIVIGVKDPIGS